MTTMAPMAPEARESASENPLEEQFPGFWRRFAAFFVDSLLLGAIGLVLGWLMFDQLAALGGTGRLLGFVIAVGYFGALNSRWGGGQTLGKRLLGLRTVRLNGELLTPARALARAVVLCAPWFLNGLEAPSVWLNGWIGSMLAGLVIFGLALGSIYLAVFNRPSRRVVHDWTLQTVVVWETLRTPPHIEPLWRGHQIILALLAGSALAGPLLLRATLNLDTHLIMTAWEALQSEPGQRFVGVRSGETWTTTTQGRSSTKYLLIQTRLERPDQDVEELRRRLVARLLTMHELVRDVDTVGVATSYGFDIGIASAARSDQVWHTPDEWRALLTGQDTQAGTAQPAKQAE